MALKQEDLFKLDLYELLGLEVSCSLQDVKKAFRKKALKCHPDKNPDDPNAAQLFYQLSCALEILSDVSARAAYNKVLNGRKVAKIRNQQLDSRIKKLKEDLEERERNADYRNSSCENDEKKLQAEVERLRKEGSRFLEEEISRMQEDVRSKEHFREHKMENNVFSIRWQVEKGDPDNGGYSYSVLHDFLTKYGDVVTLLISPKRKGRAVVEFKTWDAAMKAVQFEKGLINKPLTFEAIGNGASSEHYKKVSDFSKKNCAFPCDNEHKHSSNAGSFNASPWPSKMNSRLSDDELERAVLEKLRHKERMKRAADCE